MRYFISKLDMERFRQFGLSDYISDGQMAHHIRLFNADTGGVFYVRAIKRPENRAGWIVEADYVPDYFKHALQPE